jgi:hypothetical protein
MISHLSLPPICVLCLFAFVTTVAQNLSAQDRNHALSDLQQACPAISVSCPSDLKDGEPLTFTATVSGGHQNVVPKYNWTVSAGRITSGQGSASIKVDITDFAGQSPTATVTVIGFDLACPATASCSLIIEHLPNSIRFDSFGSIARKKEIARLNAFAVQLENQPGTQGYLLVYGGRRGRAGEAQRMAARSLQYLVKTRGIDAGRIVTVDAGFKEEQTTDLWLVPTGANLPVADPTVDPSEVKITKTVKRKSSRR